MVLDLGLHIDPQGTHYSVEEIEIRRRIFWAAFICDKLQSLYLGRPMAINLRDAHVSRNFHDTFEELELWDPRMECMSSGLVNFASAPVHSVSTFQQFCLLSRIMTRIIKKFYIVGASGKNAKTNLQTIQALLQAWREQLPRNLLFENYDMPSHYPPPNIMSLNATYHALVILLHRPFISHGHLRLTVAPQESWKICSIAAQSITTIVKAYHVAYTLRSAPYILSYALYVSCTVHVRNSALQDVKRNNDQTNLLADSLMCLDELCKANPGVRRPASIIRGLMTRHGIVQRQSDSLPDIQETPPMDLDKLLSMFPAVITSTYPGHLSAGKQSTPNMALEGYDGSRTGTQDANLVGPFVDQTTYFSEFLDPLYGHLEESTSSLFDLNGMDFV